MAITRPPALGRVVPCAEARKDVSSPRCRDVVARAPQHSPASHHNTTTTSSTTTLSSPPPRPGLDVQAELEAYVKHANALADKRKVGDKWINLSANAILKTYRDVVASQGQAKAICLFENHDTPAGKVAEARLLVMIDNASTLRASRAPSPGPAPPVRARGFELIVPPAGTVARRVVAPALRHADPSKVAEAFATVSCALSSATSLRHFVQELRPVYNLADATRAEAAVEAAFEHVNLQRDSVVAALLRARARMISVQSDEVWRIVLLVLNCGKETAVGTASLSGCVESSFRLDGGIGAAVSAMETIKVGGVCALTSNSPSRAHVRTRRHTPGQNAPPFTDYTSSH